MLNELDLGTRIALRDCGADPRDAAFRGGCLANDPQPAVRVPGHLVHRLDHIVVVQVADDSLDLDMSPPADDQDMIAFGLEVLGRLVDPRDQGTRRVHQTLAGGGQPLPLPVADPMSRDQYGRRRRQRVRPLRLAPHREPTGLELRLDDLVVDELPVDRHRGRFFNRVDHLQSVADPETKSQHLRSNHPHEASFRPRE